MSEVISKELLSEVLVNTRDEVSHIQDGRIKSEICYMVNGATRGLFINIYELVHRCKEWAFSQNYILQVRSADTLSCVDILDNKCVNNPFKKQTSCKTEPEAVFNACQWILDNKDKR